MLEELFSVILFSKTFETEPCPLQGHLDPNIVSSPTPKSSKSGACMVMICWGGTWAFSLVLERRALEGKMIMATLFWSMSYLWVTGAETDLRSGSDSKDYEKDMQEAVWYIN